MHYFLLVKKEFLDISVLLFLEITELVRRETETETESIIFLWPLPLFPQTNRLSLWVTDSLKKLCVFGKRHKPSVAFSLKTYMWKTHRRMSALSLKAYICSKTHAFCYTLDVWPSVCRMMYVRIWTREGCPRIHLLKGESLSVLAINLSFDTYKMILYHHN